MRAVPLHPEEDLQDGNDGNRAVPSCLLAALWSHQLEGYSQLVSVYKIKTFSKRISENSGYETQHYEHDVVSKSY